MDQLWRNNSMKSMQKESQKPLLVERKEDVDRKRAKSVKPLD
jgi:hypothetical protein